MSKEINGELLDKVSGGYSEKIVYNFNTGDVFINKNEKNTYLVIQNNYNDVKDNDIIDFAIYIGKGSEGFHMQMEASYIFNEYSYFGDSLPW